MSTAPLKISEGREFNKWMIIVGNKYEAKVFKINDY